MENKLQEKVFQSLGHVSMCWSETPKGVFESTEAKKIGDELMDFISEYIKKEKEKDLESIRKLISEKKYAQLLGKR